MVQLWLRKAFGEKPRWPVEIAWRAVVDYRRKRTELDLEIGDKLRIGDVIVTIMDTQDNQAAVLIEELNTVEELDFEGPLSATHPR